MVDGRPQGRTTPALVLKNLKHSKSSRFLTANCQRDRDKEGKRGAVHASSSLRRGKEEGPGRTLLSGWEKNKMSTKSSAFSRATSVLRGGTEKRKEGYKGRSKSLGGVKVKHASPGFGGE